MRSVDKFKEKMSNSSTESLFEFIVQRRSYQNGFVLAALRELDHRSELDPEQLDLKAEFEKKVSTYYEQKVKKEREPFIPKDLPCDISLAASLLYTAAVLTLSNYLLGVNYSFGLNGLAIPTNLIALAIAIYIHTGKYWARAAFIVVLAIEITFEILVFSMASVSSWLSWVIIAVKLVALIFLFRPAPKLWYAQRNNST